MGMADQDPRETLKVALSGMGTATLQAIVRAAYDRWNWDTGSDSDKEWFEVAEELLAEQGVGTMKNLGLMVDSGGDITLNTSNTLKVKHPNNSMDHELFTVATTGNLGLGCELKDELATFLANEINGVSTTYTFNGQTLKTVLEDMVLQALRSRI